jgi:aryl-alcohol dehydrogenase-like predicted oxidoreductase
VVEHVDALRRDLDGVKGSLPEIALRFCLSNTAVSTVIPGMRSMRSVEMDCAAPDLGPLDLDELVILKKHAWDKNFYG